jgi:hypothetical protein
LLVDIITTADDMTADENMSIIVVLVEYVSHSHHLQLIYLLLDLEFVERHYDDCYDYDYDYYYYFDYD